MTGREFTRVRVGATAFACGFWSALALHLIGVEGWPAALVYMPQSVGGAAAVASVVARVVR